MQKKLRLIPAKMLFPFVLIAASNAFTTNLIGQKVFKIYNMSNTPVFTTDIFRTVGVEENGYLYAGTLRQGLYMFNNNSWVKLGVLTNNSINDIQTDGFGGIWVGQSGYNSGPSQAITGGINYFPDTTLTGYIAYGSADGVLTRNCRGLYIDKSGYYINNRPRIWGAHMSDVTGGVTISGGVALGLNAGIPLFTRRPGTDSTNQLGSVQTIGGDDNEIWAFANANYGKNQILRYEADFGGFIGAYDNSNTPELPADMFIRSILFDSEGKRWLGLSSGGLIVKSGNSWIQVNMPSIFPVGTLVNNNSIFEDSRGKIYVGTNNGLAIYTGGNIESTLSWKLLTTADSLPHNNVFDICENLVTGNIVVATSGGIAFLKENIKAELEWDNSFPKSLYPKPRGLAADGVSRLYIKVTGGDNSPNLKMVEARILDYLDKPLNLKGKLKKTTDSYLTYSEEANGGTGQNAMDISNTGTGVFRLWYVSPEDYNSGSALQRLSSERIETVRVIITFTNGTKDSTDLDIRIVRPPLVMVHGLASGPEAWNNFRNEGGKFKESPAFKHVQALKLSGKASFTDNASHLMDPYDNNSLNYNINEIRKKGYACNQVDYVCHSMGGLMLRAAMQFQKEKFYKGTTYYKSYGKGLVHKLITINSPHNNSPIADFVAEYAPQLSGLPKDILVAIYKRFPDEQKPFDWVEPSVAGDLGNEIFPFKATDAVKNLATRKSYGGINLEATQVRNHLITGNVGWYGSNTASFIAGIDPLLAVLDHLIDVAKFLAVDPADKIFINSLYVLNKPARVWSFIEHYSANLGYPNFLGSSDLVVPLSSQTAKQPTGLTHMTNFENSPNSWTDANHVAILDRFDVGNRVLDLLNEPVNGALFSSVIPANVDPEQNAFSSNGFKTLSEPKTSYQTLSVPSQYGKSKIEILNPGAAGGLFADSTLSVTIQLKDTVGLAYIKVYFQNADTATNSRQFTQTFTFTVNPSYTETQRLSVLAVYDKLLGVEHHIDTLAKIVTNKAVADSFRVTNKTIYVTAGDSYYSSFEIRYNNKWVPIPYNTNLVTAQIENDEVVQYKEDKSFKALKSGNSKIFFSYLTFKDTVSLIISPALFENTVNRTIASGNAKNPAIWSKGTIPDDTDSIIVMTGHILTIDSTIKVRAVKAEPGGSIKVNKGTDTLKIGEPNSGKIKLKKTAPLNKISNDETFNLESLCSNHLQYLKAVKVKHSRKDYRNWILVNSLAKHSIQMQLPEKKGNDCIGCFSGFISFQSGLPVNAPSS